ncbi:ABC transporter substrate-binding protein [Nocardioides sp. cx-169]|uniref:ABC transporter substrate-binding protein n=1 Tax=Nocardioides sp. cx-169 TaxID=2899080 RepID=UPI001E484D3A|nr:ABC transporter substrate-binding protein [Nocardioides sp. cx-169]MCD4534017.1 ABC transporter substrate-binding protein [Nocardioides sp. cx-169]
MGLAACGGSSDGEEGSGKHKLVLGVPLPAMEMGYATLAVAQNRGFFADEDLDVEVQFLKDSSGPLKALAAGNVDIVSATADATLAARAEGEDVRLIFNSTKRSNQYYATLPDSDIEDVDDMLGKKIGVATLESGAKLTSDLALNFAGHDAEDVEYIATGVGAPALDALQRGRVDVLAMWAQAYKEMERTGAELNYIAPESTSLLFGTGFSSSAESIEENAEALKGFGRAWARATLVYAMDPEGAVQDVWDLYPNTRTGDDDISEAAETLQAGAEYKFEADVDPRTYKEWGTYDEKAVQAWIDAVVLLGLSDGEEDVADVYTNEFADFYNDFDPADACEKCAPEK